MNNGIIEGEERNRNKQPEVIIDDNFPKLMRYQTKDIG
jgi:hypothetical protein